jgi:hypothetical protein
MGIPTNDVLIQVLNGQAESALVDIVDALKTGQCNLFLGSAVHALPPEDHPSYAALKGKLPPIGPRLSERLAEKCKYNERFPGDDPQNLQRVSQYFEAQKHRTGLESELFDAVHKDRIASPILRGLAELDFRVIVTTNYDRLFEKALGLVGKTPITSIYHANEDVEKTLTTDSNQPVHLDAPFLFKMHGDIMTPGSIVITEEDYIQFILRFRDLQPYHAVPDKILEAIKSAPTLFIGYSLKDYNLRVWLKMLRKLVDVSRFPSNYSVDFRPDPLIWDVWSNRRRYINFVARNVWEFVPDVYQRVIGKVMPL